MYGTNTEIFLMRMSKCASKIAAASLTATIATTNPKKCTKMQRVGSANTKLNGVLVAKYKSCSKSCSNCCCKSESNYCMSFFLPHAQKNVCVIAHRFSSTYKHTTTSTPAHTIISGPSKEDTCGTDGRTCEFLRRGQCTYLVGQQLNLW